MTINQARHTPLTRQRSPWVGMPDHTMRVPQQDGTVIEIHCFGRPVSDGELRAMVGREPQGWHLSISFRDKRGVPNRYPNWDEMVHAVRELMPPELTYVQVLPPDGDSYVSAHPTTMHWHELTPTTHEEYLDG